MSTGTWERDPGTEAPSVDSSPDQGTASTHDDTPCGYQTCMMTHALAYARAGLDVLPLKPGGKAPASLHGKDDATHDVQQVRDWWVQCPDANIGIRPAPGAVVLDVDPRNGGASALVELTRPHGGLSPTWTAYTGGGGLHAWFRAPGPYKHALCCGVDLKGHDGYIVAPPSLHPSGTRYVWVNDLPIADAPPWLAALVRSRCARCARRLACSAELPVPAPTMRLSVSWPAHVPVAAMMPCTGQGAGPLNGVHPRHWWPSCAAPDST